jgi:hypothetical protein
MARLDELVRATADRQDGFLFVIGGDSFGAAFHRADDAAAWATELQLGVSSEPWPGGVELRLRIGLHTGETEATANGYYGAAVNEAQRLASAGHGGQTLLSAVTVALLNRNDLRDLGVYRLDGDETAEQHIFQLGPGKHQVLRGQHHCPGNLPRRLGRLIGREQDLQVIVSALAQSPVVTLIGPGGIGKTRLALTAAQQLADLDRSGAWLIDLTSITSSSDVTRVAADTGDRGGRGPQQNPDPTGPGGPPRRSPAPADRRPPNQPGTSPDPAGHHRVVLRPAHPTPAGHDSSAVNIRRAVRRRRCGQCRGRSRNRHRWGGRSDGR